MRRAKRVQDVPGPIVEHHLHQLDLGSRKPGESGLLGEKLAQEAIGVLIYLPLRRVLGAKNRPASPPVS